MKLLIADDVRIIREHVKRCVKWENFGITEIHEATNGNEAVDIIIKEKIDIALLDIKMPGATGLEVVNTVSKCQSCNCRFVMITSFDDFKYIQTALRLNVIDYIVKPIDRNELVQAVNKCILSFKDSKKTREESLENTILTGNDWLSTNVGKHSQDIDSSLENILSLHQTDYWFVLSCKSKNEGNIICSITKDIPVFTFSPSSKSTFKILVIPVIKTTSSRLELEDAISNNFNNKNIVRTDSSIRACEFISNFIDYRKSEILATSSTQTNPQLRKIRIAEMKGLARKAYSMDTYTLQDRLNTFIQMKLGSDLCLYDAEDAIFEYLIELDNISHESGYDVPEIKKSYKDKYFLLRFNSLEELISYLTDLTLKAWNFQDKTNLSSFEKIELFIKSNLDKDLSTMALSEEFNLSPNYISQLFKSTSGKNLSTFIEECRMKKALDLIKHTDFSVTEIAFRTGYNDAGYFSKVFKQYYNASPSKFKSH